MQGAVVLGAERPRAPELLDERITDSGRYGDQQHRPAALQLSSRVSRADQPQTPLPVVDEDIAALASGSQAVALHSLERSLDIGAARSAGARVVPVRAHVTTRQPRPEGSSVDRAAMKASWGTSTRPTIFIRFLPSFCFSSSLRLRVMSPP